MSVGFPFLSHDMTEHDMYRNKKVFGSLNVIEDEIIEVVALKF